jgi:transposase
VVLKATRDNEQIIERIAALDIGKEEVVCCVRVPDPASSGKRLQEVSTHRTMTRSLLVLCDRLRELGVTRVIMEATSEYWKAPFYLLEAAGFETWLVNAKDVRHLPGRPKTDTLDSVWLCKVAERQMVRPSFVPPPQVRVLRDLTRYRIDQVGVRNADKQRVEKLLEDTQIKLSVVASNIFGVSGREMMAALIGGERDPKALAGMARARLRAKAADLEEAFYGSRFNDHHAFLLAKMLARVDAIEADLADLDARIDQEIQRQDGSWAQAVARLDAIPGVGVAIAQVIIAEVGLDMSRFPTAGHLVSWAKFAPTVKESAGRKKGKNTTGHGNAYLARALGQAAAGAAKTNTFLGERYRRIARRRGRKKALVAVGRSILVTVWHLLADPTADFIELGPDFHDRHVSTQRAIRNHVRHLEAFGYQVSLHPAV